MAHRTEDELEVGADPVRAVAEVVPVLAEHGGEERPREEGEEGFDVGGPVSEGTEEGGRD